MVNSTEDYSLAIGDLVDFGFLTQFPNSQIDDIRRY